MMQAMENSLKPLPILENDEMDRLMLSSKLMDRTRMLKLLDDLFSPEQRFALLDKYTRTPPSKDYNEQAEEIVDILLCSILRNAGDNV